MLQPANINTFRGVMNVIDTGDAPVLHGVIMSKKSLSDAERNKWRAIIDGMVKDGTMLKILKKYFDNDMAASMLDF